MIQTRILLIEPDTVLAGEYRKFFSQAGFVVDWSTNAKDAIELADQRQPSLVICEIQLVGHSGIEFLYEFRSYSDWQEIPVLVFTKVPQSEFSNSTDLLFQDLNVSTYLYKFNTSLSEVLSAVNSLVKV